MAGDLFIVLRHFPRGCELRRRWHVITPTLHKYIGTLDGKSAQRALSYGHMKYQELNDNEFIAPIKGLAHDVWCLSRII